MMLTLGGTSRDTPPPRGRFLEWKLLDPADWAATKVRPLREAVTACIRREILDSELGVGAEPIGFAPRRGPLVTRRNSAAPGDAKPPCEIELGAKVTRTVMHHGRPGLTKSVPTPRPTRS